MRIATEGAIAMKRSSAKLLWASGSVLAGVAPIVAVTLTLTNSGSAQSSLAVRADTATSLSLPSNPASTTLAPTTTVTPTTPTPTTAPLSTTAPTGPAPVTKLSRQDAIATVRKVTFEVPANASLTAKLVTWGELRTKGNLGWVANSPDSQLLWAISITGGGIKPAFANGLTYEWAVAQVDPETGQIVGMSAGPATQGKEAPYFAALTDLAPAS
jgi:hypothetical protein